MLNIYVLAGLIGIVCGLRAMTGPAVVSWAAYLGLLPVADTWLDFLSYPATPYILTALAVMELIADQLPKTPPRIVPVQFGTRILTGAVCGAALAFGVAPITGLVLGAVGAIIGTLVGYTARRRLVAANGGRDFPVALAEDFIAIAAAIGIVAMAS